MAYLYHHFVIVQIEAQITINFFQVVGEMLDTSLYKFRVYTMRFDLHTL